MPQQTVSSPSCNNFYITLQDATTNCVTRLPATKVVRYWVTTRNNMVTLTMNSSVAILRQATHVAFLVRFWCDFRQGCYFFVKVFNLFLALLGQQ